MTVVPVCDVSLTQVFAETSQGGIRMNLGNFISLKLGQSMSVGLWSLILTSGIQNGQYRMSCLMTKPTKWHVRPVKTQIGPVWSVFNVRMKKTLGPWPSLKRTTKTLIRLGRCPGWSKSLLRAQIILLVLSWGSSNKNYFKVKFCTIQTCYSRHILNCLSWPNYMTQKHEFWIKWAVPNDLICTVVVVCLFVLRFYFTYRSKTM